MRSFSNKEEFKNLFDESGFSREEYAHIMGFSRHATIRELLNGIKTVSDGHIADAVQILEDQAWWRSHLLSQKKNGVFLPNGVLLKKVVDELNEIE